MKEVKTGRKLNRKEVKTGRKLNRKEIQISELIRKPRPTENFTFLKV